MQTNPRVVFDTVKFTAGEKLGSYAVDASDVGLSNLPTVFLLDHRGQDAVFSFYHIEKNADNDILWVDYADRTATFHIRIFND